MVTGIRPIDSLLTCGKGQRIGLFGGSGVGKSTLLGAMSRKNSAQVSVIALIGERNREVKAFLEQELGPEGMTRSVVVVATSDRPAPLRIRAAFVALAAAEYFRDQGKDVLLVMDSVTRLAMAQREIGLAAGEPPSQKGYTPSVFALLPKIFERAGNFENGSITGFFTVLVEGDDFNEPICDAARGILDGHFILSRELASAGHYPAIDVLNSVSRLSNKVVAKEELEAAQRVREALALYQNSADLIQLGAHVQGTNPKLDLSIRVRPHIQDFLRQEADAHCSEDETRNAAAGAGAGTGMKSFRFPLQRVLDWRSLQLRAEEEKLAGFQQKLAALIHRENALNVGAKKMRGRVAGADRPSTAPNCGLWPVSSYESQASTTTLKSNRAQV